MKKDYKLTASGSGLQLRSKPEFRNPTRSIPSNSPSRTPLLSNELLNPSLWLRFLFLDVNSRVSIPPLALVTVLVATCTLRNILKNSSTSSSVTVRTTSIDDFPMWPSPLSSSRRSTFFSELMLATRNFNLGWTIKLLLIFILVYYEDTLLIGRRCELWAVDVVNRQIKWMVEIDDDIIIETLKHKLHDVGLKWTFE